MRGLSEELNTLNLYTIEEASQKLSCTEKHLYKLASEQRLKSYRIERKTFFDKEEVDNIQALLQDTYSYQEIVAIVRNESNHDNITQTTIKNYIEKHFGLILNPLNGKDFRLYKKDKPKLIELINKNYKEPRSEKDVLKEVLKPFIAEVNYIESDVIDDYYDFHFLKDYSKRNALYQLGDNKRTLQHILMVCNEQGVKWFTNRSLNNVYIAKADFEKYKAYYDKVKNFDPEQYYTNTEVKEMFGIMNTDRIAEYANAFKVKNKLYFDKKKIDELKYVQENTITNSELMEKYNISSKSLKNLMKKLGIKYIPKNTYPLINAMLVYKEDVPKIENYLNEIHQLENASTDYDRFQLETKHIQPTAKIPKTLDAFDKFIIQRFKDNQTKYVYTNLVNVYSVIIPKLEKEIMNYNTEELIELMEAIPQLVAKREFSFFLQYCKKRYLTKYKDRFKIETNTLNERSGYTFERWYQFALLLFTQHEELLAKSIDNRINAMVWLYCAMHYVCAWRADDLLRMPYPNLEEVLGMNEEEVLKCIKSRQFTLEMAQRVVNNVMFQVKMFHIQPKKNKKKNKQRLKLVVSDSYVYTIGMLIALCEAHRKKIEKSSNRWFNTSTILTNRVTKRETHIALFGEKYNEIFGQETFLNNRANKTYMNFAQVESQQQKWGMGYDLSAIIRGHIKDKQGIAKTTQVYLEHINKSNDIDKITQALTERGSFGFMSHLLLKVIKDEEDHNQYALLDMAEQNKEIQELFGLKPIHIELMVKGINEYRSRISEVFRELITSHKGQMKEILQKISMGETPSKMEHSQCLLKTIDRSACIYPSRDHCIGCEYAMNEMYFLIEFNQRLTQLLNNIRNAKYEFDKQRYTYTLFNVYLPILQEAIIYFGKERVRAFVKISKQDIIELQKNHQLSIG